MRKTQSGVMLLEALIAILIFSLGVLGIVGMQASAISASRDAKYRADAALLANELVGGMRSAQRDGPTLATNFSSTQVCPTPIDATSTPFCQWKKRLDSGDFLPGTVAFPPVVTVAPGVVGPPATSSLVTITVSWSAPNDPAPHSYRVVVQII